MSNKVVAGITFSTEGRRIYLLGNTYPIKDILSSHGCNWDSNRKAWWTGKQETADAIAKRIEEKAAKGNDEKPGLDAVVAARVEYKGKTYYMAGKIIRGRTRYDNEVEGIWTKDGAKALLYSRDGEMKFWADANLVDTKKHYTKPMTIKALKDYAERAKREPSDPNAERRICWECGGSFTRSEIGSDGEWNAHGGHCYCGC